MTSGADGPTRYRFSVFEVDFRTGEIWKAGRRLRLGPQPLRVLQALLEHPADLVTREALRRSLWPEDTFVEFETNLNSAVRRLRTALGDSADTPRFVETVPRRGYRFLVPVEVLPPERRTGHERAEPDAATIVREVRLTSGLPDGAWLAVPSRARSIVALGAMLAVTIAAMVTVAPNRPWSDGAAVRRITAVAVLPFEDLSEGERHTYVADGTTDTIIASLAQLKATRVLAGTSVRRFRGDRSAIRTVARDLGVDAVVVGSVARVDGRLRISARLVDGASEEQIWADTFEGPQDDSFDLQGRLAHAVVQEIRATVGNESAGPELRRAVVPRGAHEAFLKARHFWNQRTADGLSLAIDHYQQALAIEPAFARARAGLAEAYILLPRYGTEALAPSFLRAKEHALGAIEIDPTLAEGHVALAKVQHVLDWNWKGAEASFRRAIDLSPGYATAHHWFSILLLSVGRVEEGLFEARRARELDPLSPTISLHLAWALFYGDQLDDARATIERAMELQPGLANAHHLLGWTHLRRGDAQGAREAFELALTLSNGGAEHWGGLVAVEVASGEVARARHILTRLETATAGNEVTPQSHFWALVALGETDAALRLVERGLRQPLGVLLSVRPDQPLVPGRATHRCEAARALSGRGPRPPEPAAVSATGAMSAAGRRPASRSASPSSVAWRRGRDLGERGGIADADVAQDSGMRHGLIHRVG